MVLPITLDSSDAKFMALLERFSERLDWMKGDAEQRTRQLEMQAGTLNALEKGMSKMEVMIAGISDELRATAALNQRVVEMEMRTTRIEDSATDTRGKVSDLNHFKDGIVNKLALVGLASFAGGSGASILIIKIIFGGHL